MLLRYLLVFLLTFWAAKAYPDPGKFTISVNSSRPYGGVAKNLYNGTRIYVKVRCSSSNNNQQFVSIGWIIRETQCWNEYAFLASQIDFLPTYYNNPSARFELPGFNLTKGNSDNYVKMSESTYECDDNIVLRRVDPSTSRPTRAATGDAKGRDNIQPVGAGGAPPTSMMLASGDEPQYVVNHDGDYLFVIHIEGSPAKTFTATVEVQMLGDHGYLSVVDWPLLPFYGLMCGLYVAMGVGWLAVSACHWRDLLRIQFWIGAVIFLGMLEKAMFYAEFQNINTTGLPTRGLILMAEVVSCAKRTLARMLVIIVSLGFGIVKPRLGPTLHRVVGIGGLYFVIASTEACLRVVRPKNDLSSGTMLAGIPLAVIDSSICWWVFSALVQTTRTLRLRRNMVKLSLYRHFTNTLIFAVIASVVFMLWSIKYHKLEECLRDWRDLWIDEAFWHLLFSIILLVIMVLWTPSKNNQRYAFTPLLDNEEDEEEEEGLYSDAFDGMKYRNKRDDGDDGDGSSSSKRGNNEEEDPLKWIEENIPESENPLPIIDSDEEIETTKFEISKMQ